jgi:dolichol-phosphate mannosyltransferase
LNRGVLILAGALLLLRVGFFALPDLYPEEAYYWNYAVHLDIGYLDHPPMVAWLIHLGTRLFGDGEFGVRIALLPCSLATGFFVYRLTTLLFDSRAGCTALLIVQVLPFFFLTGFMITPDAPLTACWAGALYFLAQALLRERAAAWLGLGVCLGLGMLSKYTIALLGPATLVFITIDAASRRWWRHPAPYAAVLLSMVIFAPVIIWNARHAWASFAFQSADRVAEARRFSTHELLAAILVVLTPIGAVLVWKALRGSRDLSPNEARLRLFARIYTLVPLSVFFVFSLTHRVKLNWTGPLWLAVIPAIAAGLATLAAEPASLLRRAWLGTVGVLVVAYVAFLTHLSLGLPGIGYAKDMALMPAGWSEMGRALEARRAAVPVPAGGRVLLVGLDKNFIASEAAYYHSRPREAVRETTGAHFFGSRALMYEFWFPPRDYQGATLLLASFDRKRLDTPDVRNRCAPLGDIEQHWVERNGRTIRPYFTRVAENYRPRETSP